jgi:Phosphoserine phosphatase RsbU, N-terminal domain
VKGPARQFRVTYASATETYVSDPCEAALNVAYELGREAVRIGLSVLELAEVHHQTLATVVLRADDRDEAAALVEAAGEVFLETLSVYEMVTRGFAEARDIAQLERRQGTVVRRLSAFLADAALAIDDQHSLDEALQLVAEHARELVSASHCEIRWLHQDRRGAGASSAGSDPDPLETMRRELSSLDGRLVGWITVGRAGPPFSAAEAELLNHLAQLTSATLERAALYRADAAE